MLPINSLFVLFYFFGYSSLVGFCFGVKLEKVGECHVTESMDSLAVAMSPGFLSGAIPYIGNNACTETGTCRNIPFACPTSSCCVASTNHSLPTALAYSQCGCWDSKRGICKPVKNFRVGLNSCNAESGIHVKSDFELASGTFIGGICKDSGVSVEIEADATTKSLIIRISSKLCLQDSRGQRDNEVPAFLKGLYNTAYHFAQNLGDLRKFGLTIPKSKLQKQVVEDILKTLSKSDEGNHSQNQKIDCSSYTDGTAISMSPNFLPGSLNNFLSQHSQVCGVSGECKISKPGCEKSGCCLMSSSKNESGCDCMANAGNCLLDHKIFKVGGLACTTKGETVKTEFVVRMPPKDLGECSATGPSSIKYVLNDAGNIEITVETKQCTMSSLNSKYLEIETIVVAEVNTDQFLSILKQLY